jgi:hypothetical protein
LSFTIIALFGAPPFSLSLVSDFPIKS